jgi:hypothetical protein
LDLLEAGEGLGLQPTVDLGVAVTEAHAGEGEAEGGAWVIAEDLGDEDESLPVLASEVTAGT